MSQPDVDSLHTCEAPFSQRLLSPEREADDSDYDEVGDSDDSGSFHSEGEELAEYWDPYLYQLQMKAPKPQRVRCLRWVPDRPPFYGDEYHGAITREETARLLGREDGRYLVRKGLSQSGTYSLSFVFDGHVRHYHLHYENGEHYVGEKTFENITDLVADGVITLYMEANDVEEYLKSAREYTNLRKVSTLSGPAIELAVDPERDEGVHSEEADETPPPPLPPRNVRKILTSSSALPGILEESGIQDSEEGKGEEEETESKEGTLEMSSGSVSKYFDAHVETQVKRKESSLYNFHYEKPHNFKVHTYISSLPWCDFCRNFMWGLTSQGYKCKDCGYNAHKQCRDCCLTDCKPSLNLVKRVYGVDLTTVVKMFSTKVPVVVKDCIDEIERRGLDLQGLYRVSGKANEILSLKKQFDNEMSAPLSSYDDTHAIAGALKLYFRELPIPLITFDCYDLVLVAARCGTNEKTLETVKVILARLPPAHHNTLRFLMRHLHRVQTHKNNNLMDSKNLALVFAPSIMRPLGPSNDAAIMIRLPEQKKVTELLISQYPVLFS